MKRVPMMVAAALLAAGAAAAEDGGPRIGRAWARATAGGAMTGAAYLTIESRRADRLVAVASALADHAELHTYANENGVLSMRPVEAIALSPGKPVVLTPGGYHIMLFDLKRTLKEGDPLPLVLTFEKAGKREVTARVGKAGAMGPAGTVRPRDMPGGRKPGA